MYRLSIFISMLSNHFYFQTQLEDSQTFSSFFLFLFCVCLWVWIGEWAVRSFVVFHKDMRVFRNEMWYANYLMIIWYDMIIWLSDTIVQEKSNNPLMKQQLFEKHYIQRKLNIWRVFTLIITRFFFPFHLNLTSEMY